VVVLGVLGVRVVGPHAPAVVRREAAGLEVRLRCSEPLMKLQSREGEREKKVEYEPSFFKVSFSRYIRFQGLKRY
jgi:hypothetical protein